MVCSGSSCSLPVTSETIWVHRPPFVPPPSLPSGFVHVLEDVPDAVGGRPEHGAVEVAPTVAQGQARDEPSRHETDQAPVGEVSPIGRLKDAYSCQKLIHLS